MRRIVNSTFISLDGVVNHMEKWHFDFIDEELETLALDHLRDADALLMGRHTYQAYSSVWPEREGEAADRINAMTKYLVSTTVTDPEWANTTVLSGDLLDEVRKMKDAPGKDILMHGYGPVAKTLMRHGLLDRLHLWVHPMLAGVGTGDDMLLAEDVNVRLALSEVQKLGSGVVVLFYEATA